MPMVSDIRRHFPDANIDWVVEEAYVSLVRMHPDVRTIIPIALRRWRKNLLSAATWREIADFRSLLKREAYDIVFDTQGLLKTSLVMRMARMAADGKRVGLANATEGSGYEPLSRIFHTSSIPVDVRSHAVLRARLVAGAALGYEVGDPINFKWQSTDLGLALLPSCLPAEPYAVFFHASARTEKQWDASNWIQVAKQLSQRNLLVLLPWGDAAEKQVAEYLASQMENARVLPRLSLMEAVMLARHAALVIGVDTGLTHVAAAFDRPTIELYCDSPRWKTEGNWSAQIVNLGDTGSAPSVEQVSNAVSVLLDSIRN